MSGSGPPIVLLHAALHDRTDFAPVHRGAGEGPSDAGPGLARSWRISPTCHPLRAVEFGDLLVEFADQLDLSNIVDRRQLGRRLRRLPVGAGATRACRRPGARQHRRLHPAQCRSPGSFCAVMGRPSVVKAVFPAFVRAYMRAKNPTDEAVVDRVVARAKTDAGARTAAALWNSFTEPGHDLRDAGRRDQRTGADHLGRQGCHRSAAMGQGRPGRDSRVQIRGPADRPRRLRVGAGGVAGGGPAVRRRSARCPCRAPQLRSAFRPVAVAAPVRVLH